MKKLTFYTFPLVLLFIFNSAIAQVNCPFNTPEFPFETQDDWWGDSYSWSAGLYLSSQLGGAQNFTNISFRLDSEDSWGGSYTYNDIRIYLRHTSVSNYAFDTGYPGTAGFTQVYSGNMVFNGTGVYTFNFNVAGNFAYNGSDQLEVLIENRGGNFHSEEPWFDRTDPTPAGIFPGKVWAGSSWANATSNSSNRRFNLQINTVGCAAYPLPVELLKSDAQCTEDQILFSWSTASEKNNSHFIIEYSENGKNWSEIKRVTGVGNSSVQQDYSVTLRNRSQENVNYIRLSQEDFNGDSERLVTHSVSCSHSDIKVFPNPFTSELNLHFNEKKTTLKGVKLFDNVGKEVFSTSTEEEDFIQISTSQIPPGIYTLQISENGVVNSYKKVVKQ